MALLEKGAGPSRLELRWFGVIFFVFTAVLGSLVLSFGAPLVASGVIWGIGLTVCAAYYALPSTRYLIYDVWMALVFPIGWVFSHLLMAVLFYLVLTPTGLVMRLFGWDGLMRKRRPDAETYWLAVDEETETRRYFQQF
jgi:hypothetical protein